MYLVLLGVELTFTSKANLSYITFLPQILKRLILLLTRTDICVTTTHGAGSTPWILALKNYIYTSCLIEQERNRNDVLL